MKQPQNGEKQDEPQKDDHIYDGHDHEHDHDHEHEGKGGKPAKPGKPKREGPPTEEDLQKQLTILEVARNRIEAFSREADLLGSALRDHTRATETLKAIDAMEKKPAEVLVPIGAGVFIFAKPSVTNKVLMNIGNGITAEFAIGDAREKLTSSLKDLEEKEKKVVAELERLEASAEALTHEVQTMYEEMQRAKQA
jgi:prefoldin alpha subunit